MKEWLTIIIVLLIIGILLDGIRRMRAHRKEAVRLSKNMVDTDPLFDEEVGGSEFPSGGARVASYREQSDLDNVHQTMKESYAASRVTRGAPVRRQPEQEALNLDTPVPMLMESVRNNAEEPEDEPPYSREPSLGNFADLDADLDQESAQVEHSEQARPWEEQGDSDFSFGASELEDDEPEEDFTPTSTPVFSAAESRSRSSGVASTQYDDTEFDDDNVSAPRPAPKAGSAPKPQPAVQPEAEALAPDEVLVMNVMARRGEVFAGADLMQALIDLDLRYGEMDIFHRHEGEDGRGRILFSLANMVKPGVFDLAAMDEFQTPGISLFLTLPIKSDSLAAYNLMANTAQGLAEALDGELKDENRSVMTRQTIEHGRQRVMEYERKRRLAKA